MIISPPLSPKETSREQSLDQTSQSKITDSSSTSVNQAKFKIVDVTCILFGENPLKLDPLTLKLKDH